jgi:hypothetical protein
MLLVLGTSCFEPPCQPPKPIKQDADTQVRGAYREASRGGEHSEASRGAEHSEASEATPGAHYSEAAYGEGGDREAADRHRHNLPPTCATARGAYAEQTTGASSTTSASSSSYTTSNTSYNHDIIEHHIKASIARHTERGGGGRARCLSSVYASISPVSSIARARCLWTLYASTPAHCLHRVREDGACVEESVCRRVRVTEVTGASESGTSKSGQLREEVTQVTWET